MTSFPRKARSDIVLPTNFSLGLVVETSLMFHAAWAASHSPARSPTRGSGLGAPGSWTSTARIAPACDGRWAGAGADDAAEPEPEHADTSAAADSDPIATACRSVERVTCSRS